MNRIKIFSILILLFLVFPVFAEEVIVTDDYLLLEEVVVTDEQIVMDEVILADDLIVLEEITVTEDTIIIEEVIITDDRIVIEEVIITDDAVITEEFVITAEEPVYLPREYTPPVLEGIRNNRYYLESLRLTRLAHDTFEFGDYDASAGFAQEAIRFAQLSDEYVAEQLIIEAKRLLDWADSNNIANRHPNEYNEGKSYYEAGVLAHEEENLEESISSSTRSIGIFSALATGRPVQSGPSASTTTAAGTSRATGLPAQYTVRTWTGNRDCLWNIAGYSWVYGDPNRWRTLYEANRSRLPDPNNPNLIEPGFVLDIPSIRGETRQGMWEPGRVYGSP